MIYTKEVENMCPVAKGAKHEPAPIPEEGKWVHSKKIEDISGFTHGVGWCAPQQGACKLSLNVKNGVIEEALVETIGCSGMTHSAAMAAEVLQGKTILEALNTDLVCDAINTAMIRLLITIFLSSLFSERPSCQRSCEQSAYPAASAQPAAAGAPPPRSAARRGQSDGTWRK